DRCWSELEAAEALPPPSGSMLLGVRVSLWLPLLRPRRRATLTSLAQGQSRKLPLLANEDGLFDVTDAQLLG
ncbi:MAG TPA: hypothetical protein VF030_04745, partial [Solirubrobacterales bacterium]